MQPVRGSRGKERRDIYLQFLRLSGGRAAEYGEKCEKAWSFN